MRLGFLIDQRRCIGCHACTVACKQEQEVPLGVFRTWVKYIEKGEFPNTRRHFTVLRCNHCDDAPCIEICPTTALFRRSDGIVDFDQSRCIGCKSCMQACPYDALYIDPLEHTAAKCNFCAHRIDVGLKPACEIVCPETAIISGDLDDPSSVISNLIAREPVQVRKPEQGTQPKLFYINADALGLTPNLSQRESTTMWGQLASPPGTTFPRVMEPQHLPLPEGIVRDVYDVAHAKPWGWKVSAYLWTKSIAAGALGVAAAVALASRPAEPFGLVAAVIATVFALGTAVLLIIDLKRPERFWFILLKPNFRSWLVWGAYILTIFGLVAAAWGAASLFGIGGLVAPLAVLALAFGAAAAGYSGFLFGQAEGRDFWQSPLLPLHLVVQAAVAGAGALVIAAAVMGADDGIALPVTILLVGVLVHAVLVAAELVMPHANSDVRLAARAMTHGADARLFWVGAILIGVAVPLVALAGSAAAVLPVTAGVTLASLAAVGGLLAYEDSWIRAGQAVPLS